jgi:NAD(P)-dependent dehydrogenase (short-subunit alcohol dehydrogenase family)
MQFDGQTAVVTGAARGIGQATGRGFHREGANVAVLDVDEAGADLEREFGERGLFLRCDVSRAADVDAAFATIVGRFGEVAVLVNNAGMLHYGTVTETSEQDWDRVLAVNLKSAFLCAKYAIPSMLRRGKGVVINLASVQSLLSQHGVAPYTTSKTAMLGLTRSIAIDYAPTVRCVAVCPGTVDTPMLHWAIQQSPDPDEILDEVRHMHPMGRVATPAEVAELILFLAGDKAGFITGGYIRIDGGLGLSIGGSKRS